MQDALDLRTAVAEHVGDVTDYFPRLVVLAESFLNKRVKASDQIKTVDLTIVDGLAQLPSDFMSVISVNQANRYAYTQSDPSYAQSARFAYWISGQDINVAPGIAGDVKLIYKATLPTLSQSLASSNWLLLKAPDVYLYAVAEQAARRKNDREMVADMRSLLSDAVFQLNKSEGLAMYGQSGVRLPGVVV